LYTRSVAAVALPRVAGGSRLRSTERERGVHQEQRQSAVFFTRARVRPARAYVPCAQRGFAGAR